MIQSFQYFTGGTQERGVRISAVEGLLFQVPRLRGVFVPLLVNQVIYVLTKVPESSSKERSEGPETGEREAGNKPLTDHEKDNLNRMIALLAELRRRDPNHEREYTNLAAKIREKCKRVEGETKARLELQLARLDGR